jgi:hypothetical protein
MGHIRMTSSDTASTYPSERGGLDCMTSASTERSLTGGQDTDAVVRIGRVIQLSDAWQRGGQQLNAAPHRERSINALILMGLMSGQRLGGY